MEPISRIDLNDRARGRAASIFQAWDLLQIAAPLGNLESLLNQTHRHRVEQLLAISNRAADIHEDQHQRETMQSMAEIAQDERVAQDKYNTGIQRNAIRLAAEEVAIAVKLYDAEVRGIIMSAREYAAAIERDLIALEAARAAMDVRKQQLKLIKVTCEIQEQAVQRAMVQADIAKAKLAAAKARVQVLMAEYEANQAEIKVIQTELEEVKAEVEKMTLRADVAMIFADIVTRKLAETKFDVENTHLLEQFEYVAWKLADMLKRWDLAIQTAGVHEQAEIDIMDIFYLLIEADRQEHLLSLYKIVKDTELLAYERGRTMSDTELATMGSHTWREARAELLEMKYTTWKALLEADGWAKRTINAAKRWVYLHGREDVTMMTDETQLISKG
jgi:hypothetical protein